MTKLRLAIVGAGPAGIYAADILLKAERKFDVSIDLFEQLPAPYGLVRYGVAPDHPRIKGIITALREVLDRGDIRLFGNVRFGEDITLDDLKRHYNAVIFATGAVRDTGPRHPGHRRRGLLRRRRLRELVRRPPGRAARVAARRASRSRSSATATSPSTSRACSPSTPTTCFPPRSRTTSTPDSRPAGHRRPRLRPPRARTGEVHAARAARARRAARRRHGRLRRGLRLRRRVEGRDRQQQAGHGDRPRAAVVAQAPESVNNAGGEASRRLHLHFYAKPLEVVTDDEGRVAAFRWERTRPDGEGGVVGTGEVREVADPGALPRGRLLRLAAARRAVRQAPRRDPEPRGPGRCTRTPTSGSPASTRPGGSSAARWGSSATPSRTRWRRCATSSTTRASWWQPADPSEEAIPALLAERGVALDRPRRLAPARRARDGARRARRSVPRIKVVPRDEMIQVSRGE